MSARGFIAACLVTAAAAGPGGCERFGASKSPFQGVDVTGSDIGRELHLRDASGRERSLADFRGKVVVVSFGYTHCPDVCPMTLSNLASAVKQLGPDGSRVQVLFVTVDPERDTPQVLAEYVPAFNPGFIGLTGTPEELARVTRDFHVYASTRKEGGTYLVDHSAQIFALDPAGRMRLVFAPDTTPQVLAADLRLLLNG